MAQNRLKIELVDGGHLEFRYLDLSKYKNDARNGLSMPHLVGKVLLTVGSAVIIADIYMITCERGNAERERSRFKSLLLVHGFLWPFTFKLHFEYGRRRPSWILMVGQVKIQKRCQKWILHAKISRESGITQLSISICFQVTFPIWPPAAILDFGFSQIPPPFSRGSWGRFFSKYFKELKSSVKP